MVIPVSDEGSPSTSTSEASSLSSSGCSLLLLHEGRAATLSDVLCEYAVFGAFGSTKSAKEFAIVAAPGDSMACGSLDEASVDLQELGLTKFALLAKRGECTMSHKAQWAMAAGASVVIVGHSVSGERPVRMRSVGDEAQLVDIPSIMVSFENSNALFEIADKRDFKIKLITSIAREHANELELTLKQRVFSPRSKKEQRERDNHLMHLGEYFSQRGWTDDATVIFTQAARVAQEVGNFQVLYGVGTFFWNVKQQPLVAKRYHFLAIEAALAKLYAPIPELDSTKISTNEVETGALIPLKAATAYADALTTIKNVIVLIPEDEAQSAVVTTFSTRPLTTLPLVGRVGVAMNLTNVGYSATEADSTESLLTSPMWSSHFRGNEAQSTPAKLPLLSPELRILAELLEFLIHTRKIGTQALLEWAAHVDKLGGHEKLMGALSVRILSFTSRIFFVSVTSY